MAAVSQTFEDMYKTHYVQLRNWAHNIIGDQDAAHDVVQEVFLKLWPRREELDAIANHKAYLFRSVINASVTYLETHKKKLRVAGAHPQTAPGADSSMLQKELEARVQRALDALPPKCKAVFMLSRFEEMKYKEIAEVLGLSVKTVENQMGIAIKKMRDELRPYLAKESVMLSLLASTSLFIPLSVLFS